MLPVRAPDRLPAGSGQAPGLLLGHHTARSAESKVCLAERDWVSNGPNDRRSLRATDLSRDGSARLVVHARDQQFVRMALVVDPKGRHAPTSHDSTRAKSRDWPFKLPVCQAFDAPRDLCVELRCGGWIAFVEIGDRLDDVSDRIFGVGDLQRPRAASRIVALPV
jgi:hypothetical protein